MNANRPGLDAISSRIIGCAFAVANALGSVFLEKVYDRAHRAQCINTGRPAGTCACCSISEHLAWNFAALVLDL